MSESNSVDSGFMDTGNVTIIEHIVIRDPDSGEVILRQRDKQRNDLSKGQAESGK
jgi:hypothetical protein